MTLFIEEVKELVFYLTVLGLCVCNCAAAVIPVTRPVALQICFPS